MMFGRFPGPGPGDFGGHDLHIITCILMVFFVFFVIGLILMFVRMVRGRGMMMHGMRMHGMGMGMGDPLEIAKMRYAKGEISEAEFETIKKNLS